MVVMVDMEFLFIMAFALSAVGVGVAMLVEIFMLILKHNRQTGGLNINNFKGKIVKCNNLYFVWNGEKVERLYSTENLGAVNVCDVMELDLKEKQEFLKTRAKRLAEESIKHIKRVLWYPRILFLINTSLILIHLALIPELRGTFRFLLLSMFFLWVVYEFLVVKLLVSTHSRLGFTVKFAQDVARRTLIRRFDGRAS
ncbi:MAG: hypothetical protein GXO25_02460, partial [Euryarchaeota archaeon]|nr:hypothetical protein [Euryarchaeota archaeon]